MRRSFEHGRLENGAAVSAGELGGATATAMATVAATVAALRRRRRPKTKKWECGDGAGEGGACCSALWPILAVLGRAPATRGSLLAPRGDQALASVGH